MTPQIRALAESPAMMRSYVRAVLAEWGMAATSETAELIVTELVTNVATAPGAQEDRVPVYQLGLFSDRRVLVIEVFDMLPGTPERREAATDDEHGRGLAIVEVLSEEWGIRPHPRGKVIYARVRAA